MTKTHTIRAGDCVASLAAEHGFADPLTVWDSPDNASLKKERKSPFLLLEGDRLAIPDRARRQDAPSTDARHRYRRKQPEVWLRLRMRDEDEPRADEPYQLVVDDLILEGSLDGDGRLEERIPPTATNADLHIGESDDRETYALKLGSLPPVDTVAGAQARMQNLGFECGPIDNIFGRRTDKGLREFQSCYGESVTGKIDEATCAALEKEHGC